MRGLVQRVRAATVDVEGEEVGRIGGGLCVLVGVTHDDTPEVARKLADKIWNLRVMDDEAGVMNRSVADTTGEVLVLLKDGFEVNCTPVSETRLNISFLVEKAMVPVLQDPAVRERLLDEAKAKSFFQGHPIGKPPGLDGLRIDQRPVHGRSHQDFHAGILCGRVFFKAYNGNCVLGRCARRRGIDFHDVAQF